MLREFGGLFSMKIRIFSIEEFSVYDGPGIRTTVFLKGCPLNCSWCHSPEGKTYDIVSLRSPNGCLECGKCFQICPNNREKCIACGKCIEVCPRHLIRLSGEDVEIQDLADTLSKNVDILNLNNGGITFSGGEPLLQIEALTKLLQLMQGKTHLALQTSGYTSLQNFQKVLPYLDLVLFDMKIMDHDLAKKFEGIDNSIILNNLEYLKTTSTPFIARVPLIPTVIDTEENILAIIDKLKDAKNLIAVELLPYNKYAGSKYKMCGKQYQPGFDESIPSNPHLELFEKAHIKARML